MFQDRFSAALESAGSASSIEMNELVYELKRKNKDPIILSYGEAPFEFHNFGFSEEDFSKGAHYSDSRGLPELRDAICKNLYSPLGISVDKDKEILITAGSKLGSYIILKSILEKGDKILLHEPAWVTYQEHAKLCGAQADFISFGEDFMPNLMKKFNDNKFRCLILNNPNNPRGHLYLKADLEQIISVCHDHNVYVIIDESYSDYVVGTEFTSGAHFFEKYRNVIILNSLSKNMGLSGWRIGFVVANGQLINKALHLNRHLITCAPTILQIYCAKHFSKILSRLKPEIQRLQLKRGLVADELKKQNISFLSGHCTFYYFLDFRQSISNTTSFVKLLLENKNVALVPGKAYGASTEGFLRLSFSVESIERVSLGLRLLKQQIDEIS